MKKLILPILLGFIAVIAFASGSKTYTEIIPNPEGKNYIYRITLKDKAETPFSLSEPEKFLSLKSIERRSRQGIGFRLYRPARFSGIPEADTTARRRGGGRQQMEQYGPCEK